MESKHEEGFRQTEAEPFWALPLLHYHQIEEIRHSYKLQRLDISYEDINSEQIHKAVYLVPFYVAEMGIPQRFKKLIESESNIRPIHPEKAIEWVQQKLNIEPAEKARDTVLLAADSKVLIITGGPGTGKTTIITAILKIFQQLKPRILLAVPTGRAAKRMSEVTGWVSII